MLPRLRVLTIALVSVGALIALACLWRLGRRTAPRAPQDEADVNAPSPHPPSPIAPPSSSPPAPAVPATTKPEASPSRPAADAHLLEEIRASVRSDPQRAEALAREGRRRFPNSPTADERDALLVDALINQQRIGAARSETYYYYDHHPNGKFGAHLFSMTGVHPPPPAPGPP